MHRCDLFTLSTYVLPQDDPGAQGRHSSFKLGERPGLESEVQHSKPPAEIQVRALLDSLCAFVGDVGECSRAQTQTIMCA